MATCRSLESVALVRAIAPGMLFKAEPAKMIALGAALPRLLLRPAFPTAVEKAKRLAIRSSRVSTI